MCKSGLLPKLKTLNSSLLGPECEHTLHLHLLGPSPVYLGTFVMCVMNKPAVTAASWQLRHLLAANFASPVRCIEVHSIDSALGIAFGFYSAQPFVNRSF